MVEAGKVTLRVEVDAKQFKQVMKEITRDNAIHLSVINRHPVDIMRTLAHEYVHYKQVMDGKQLKSHAGSPSENEANAKAGEIMRKYGRLHPELFDLMPIR